MAIQIYDTTLREGMQTPGGIGANNQQRIAIAHHIANYADWIELGMPANPVDYKNIQEITQSFSDLKRQAGLSVLCRLHDVDIERAEKVLRNYNYTMAHLFIGVSEEHRRFRGNRIKEAKEYEDMIFSKLHKASSIENFSRIMFSPEDGIRGYMQDPEQTSRFIEKAIQGYRASGRKEPLIINQPDTTGGSSVTESLAILEQINARFGNAIEISTHCHNDSQMANAHSFEAAVSGVAPWIQTTFGQLGERNGIAQIETMLAMLYTRGLISEKPYATPENMSKLHPTAKTIMGYLGRTIPAENGVTGLRVNISTSGIHTDVVSKNEKTYHIHGHMFGANPSIEFGPTSGINQIIPTLAKIGITKQKSELGELVDELKQRANNEQRIFSESDIWYHAINRFTDVVEPLLVQNYSIAVSRDGEQPVTLEGVYEGQPFRITTHAAGPIDGTINALEEVINTPIKLMRYEPAVIPSMQKTEFDYSNLQLLEEISPESDLRVQCAIECDGVRYSGYARSPNVFTANIESVIDAVTKMCTIQAYQKKKMEKRKNAW